VSDFLAEVEARRLRPRTPDAPIAAAILAFVAAFLATLLALPLTHEAAIALAAGEVSFPPFAARVLGIALATTAAVGGLLWVVALRRSRPRWIVPVLAGLLAVTSILGLGFSRGMGEMTEQRRQEQIARAEIVRTMDLALADGVEAPLIDTRPRSRGEVGKLEQALKEAFAAIQKIGKAFAADVDALDLDWKDGASNLSHAALRGRVERLTAAKARTETYRAAMKAEMRSLPDRLGNTGVSSSLQRSFIRGFEQTIDDELADLDRSADLQLKVLDLHLAQTRYLLDRPWAWVVTGGRVTFYRTADMQRFNGFDGEFRTLKAALEEQDYQTRKKALESRDRIAGEY
jgi:hypothetical protein